MPFYRNSKKAPLKDYPAPWTPEQIATSLWLAANNGSFYQEDGKTNQSYDGDDAGAWEDKSGNGNDAIQATASERGILRKSVLNKHPAVEFVRVNNEHFDTSLDLSITTGDFWAAAVAKPDATVDIKRILGNAQNSGDFEGFWLAHNESEQFELTVRQATGTDTVILDTNTSDDDYHIWYIERDSAVARIFKDGSPLKAESSTEDLTGHGDVAVGMERTSGSAVYDGRIAEVLLNSGTVLTAAEIKSLHEYLGDKFDLTTQYDMPFYIESPDDAAKVLDFTGNAGGHPSVVYDGSEYYMMTTDNAQGGTLYSSADGTTWASEGQVLVKNTQSWAETTILAIHMTLIGSTYSAVFAGQDSSGNRSIGVATNTGDPAVDSWTWYASNPVLNYDVLSATRVMDPNLMYFPNAFDPGNGDGSHNYWMLFSDENPAGDNIQNVHIAYADSIAGSWTVGNSGAAVIDRNDALLGHWPGQLMLVGNEIYYMYSSGAVGATPQTGWIAWAKSSDLINWTYPLLEPLTYDAGLTGYERIIAPTFIVVGEELWVYCGASTDGVGGSTRDDVVQIKMKSNTRKQVTVL